jgi:hypothetical protein
MPSRPNLEELMSDPFEPGMTDLLAKLRQSWKDGEAEKEIERLEDYLRAQQARIEEKDREIAALKQTDPRFDRLVEKGALFFDTRDGEPTGAPYCPRCRVKDNTLIRLARYYPGNIERCPVCSTEFQRLQSNGVPKVGGS